MIPRVQNREIIKNATVDLSYGDFALILQGMSGR